MEYDEQENGERRNNKLMGLCELFSKCPGQCCSYLIQNLSFLSTRHDQIKLREHGGDELEEALVPCSKRTSKRLVVERYGQGSYWVR